MALSTDSITERIVDALGFLTDDAFRYFKSYSHFRRKDAAGYSYITIDVTTRNRSAYNLAFYVGTRVDPLENVIRKLRGDDAKLDHWSRSINTYTVNIGPNSTNWDHSIAGHWPMQCDDDLGTTIPLVSEFIRAGILPFLDSNTSAESVRSTLLDTPGKTQNLMPHHQIFGADVLAGDIDRLFADHKILDDRYRRWIEHLRQDFDGFYTLCNAELSGSA